MAGGDHAGLSAVVPVTVRIDCLAGAAHSDGARTIAAVTEAVVAVVGGPAGCTGMRELVFLKPGALEWRDRADPVLQHPEDAIVRPISATLCDLDRLIGSSDTLHENLDWFR